MKYTYEFFKGPFNVLMIKLPKEIELVSELLENDVHGKEWVEELDKVLNKEINCANFRGNSCDLDVKPDFTKIIHRYVEDEEYTCEIETIELKNLMLVWLTEYENDLQNRNLN
ncbi:MULTISPECIES: hypothetical protein [Bacillus]|uniref:Uncharacterized protein n=2 Tax=Bacillaceae TaxID=186817 RepID=A0A2A8ITA2_BACCE|nr:MULTISPECIES: hypothetical protein [Bacillus]PFA62652.1 hypothetical protein CN402_07760 [Bacillus sp. AFS015896]PGL82717.1 hypothetical protein CN931_14285 [Bacillus sp. AFS054943]PER22697.1 hypothetical protein CN476_19870 [Bacillus cereus]PGU02446.1 hypothetical protein COD19_11675 [Bacillus cereus]PGX11721.1 hypothetical protein COE07_12120 [Bacillus sp. AFS033286]